MKAVAGFTLLEVLVAIAILSVMSVMAYAGLEQVVNARQKTDQYANSLAELQRTFSLLQKDLEQVVNRRTRDNLGFVKPTLMSSPDASVQLALVANNRSTLQTSEHSSRLQHIEYFLEDNTLQRKHWNILDRAHDSEAESISLLNRVEAIDLRFFSNDKVEPFWPIPSANQLIDLPTAVELTITLEDGLQVQRLFLLPGRLG